MRVLYFSILLSAVFLIYGCTNHSYEIITEDGNDSQTDYNPVQSAANQTQTAITAMNPQRIEPESSSSTVISDTKESSVTFTIQIGAFSSEKRAKELIKTSQTMLGTDVGYISVDGLYKIRVGIYGSVAEASAMLNKLKDLGYADCFVIEQ